MSDKELIWVSKDLAESFNKLDTTQEQEIMVKKIIENKRLDLESEYDLLEESMLVFKGVCLKHKNDLDSVYKEQSQKLYGLWEDMGDVSSEVKKHSDSLKSQLNGLKSEVDSVASSTNHLEKQLSNLNVHSAGRVVELAKTISNMDDSTKSIMKFLVDNYKYENL